MCCRHDFYNSATDVVLTIFAKGVPADSVVVDFGEQMLSVSIEVPGEEPYHFQPRLFAKVLSSLLLSRLSYMQCIKWIEMVFLCTCVRC